MHTEVEIGSTGFETSQIVNPIVTHICIYACTHAGRFNTILAAVYSCNKYNKSYLGDDPNTRLEIKVLPRLTSPVDLIL